MSERHSETRRALAAILIAATGAVLLLLLSLATDQHRAGAVSRLFAYQAGALLVMAAVLTAGRHLAGGPCRYLRPGRPAAPARAMPLLGVAAGESWLRVGLAFTAITLAATIAWLAFGPGSGAGEGGAGRWLVAVALALPLALSNAAVEEVVTRWTLVEGMAGRMARFAPPASAAVFGAVHWFGIPGGWSGMLMAGFLGWLLARSIQDTGGLFWAVAVHFCLDLAIFTTLLARMP